MSKQENRHRPRRLTPIERTELRIAHETLQMRPAMARMMGGPSVEEARSIVNFYNARRREG